jgi:SMI1 / KNR4 family (SUKH-1)
MRLLFYLIKFSTYVPSQAMRLSSALAGLLFMAKDLGRKEDIPGLMKRIADRIHCNQQNAYLSSVRFIWKEYLLSGWLREELEVPLDSMKEYASFITTTIKKRLDQGPLSADKVYSNYSIQQLLEELDQNTVSHPGFRDEEFAGYLEEEYGKIESILQKPATTEEISQAEARIGRRLPEELKEFMKISNGCLRVKTSPLPLFRLRLPPLDDIKFEDDEYMLDYEFTLLPDIDLGIEVEWPGIEFGGIAIYENDGQGTDYVWFVTEALVDKAKKVLQDAFDAADSTQRTAINKAIFDVYGSHEAYDNMKSCLYLQGWGEPSGQVVWPSFRSYLNWVVLESRDMKERSPLKIPSGII